MIGSSSALPFDEMHEEIDRGRFLTSPRAAGALTREFTRLSESVARRIAELRTADATDAPELRMTPKRCIVQCGAAALTLSWLRGASDSVADGQLLVIAWIGTVARGNVPLPERAAGQLDQGAPAVAVWEETLVPEASSEADWTWRPAGDAASRFVSDELAARCVEPLRTALAEHQVA